MTGTDLLITNARIVMAGEVVLVTVAVRDGRFADVQAGRAHPPQAQDWNGDYLVPGLVELHTDNLEKHLEPRPKVRWSDRAHVAAGNRARLGPARSRVQRQPERRGER
jgi:alpha-D-ribose 1-methylphosphonate 5-triphosphate diphosphatase